MIEVAYVNVFVNDLDRAVEFFESKLGLTLLHSDPGLGYASLSAGPIRIGLAVAGGDHKALVGRLTGVGLAVADLEAEHSRLCGLGVEFAMPPTRQPWGGFMALVTDPDGNTLYLDEVSAAHSQQARARRPTSR